MKRYDLITPEGTRDLLFEGCLARRMVEDRLSKLFEGFGGAVFAAPYCTGVNFGVIFDLFPQIHHLFPPRNRIVVQINQMRIR